jgi:CHRD domain
MKMIADRRSWLAACLVVVCCWASPAVVSAQSAGDSFETHLGHTGIADASMPTIMGAGGVLATLSGQTLKVEGQISGMNSPATDAHLMRGGGIGIPGAVMSNANLTLDPGGKISGSVQLSADQVAALRAGAIYVQVNSAKSPAPAGHLWGWLLPAHEKAGQDEPQVGSWFLPQGAGLNARSRNRN